MRIIKISNRFSKQWFKVQVGLLLFVQDVEEIGEQLPLSLTRSSIIIVTENLENIYKQWHFQIDMTKHQVGFDWLLENKALYKNVHTAFPTECNITDIVQIIDTSSNLNDPKVEHTKINDMSLQWI